MGSIVGAAIVAHHPGMMQPEEVRRARGGGADTDLVAGFERVRARIDGVGADTFVLFDTHWITTNSHLVAGAPRYAGRYTSSELPFALADRPYDFPGAPELAALVEQVAEERGIKARNAATTALPLQYPTLNVVARLGRGERVMPVGSCQNAALHHYLQMGEAIGEAIRRSEARVVLLASGALSHRFNDLDFDLRHPNGWHPDNLSDPRNRKFDQEIVELFRQGRHDLALDRYPEMLEAEYEGRGAHYVQMIGALGGRACRARGTPCSAYENASGTGNIHIWFDVN